MSSTTIPADSLLASASAELNEPVTAAAVAEVRFGQALRGYDVGQVDAAMAAIGRTLAGLEVAAAPKDPVAELLGGARPASRPLPATTIQSAPDTVFGDVSVAVNSILEATTLAAEQLREQARVQAQESLSGVHGQIAEARAELAAVRGQIERARAELGQIADSDAEARAKLAALVQQIEGVARPSAG